MSYYFSARRGLDPSRTPVNYGPVSVNQGEQWEESVFFPVDSEGRYMIDLKVMAADASCTIPVQCMHEVDIASDPGADMILLTKSVADMLGYNVDLISDSHNFYVQGKSGQPTVFKEVQTWVQLGNMRPLSAPVGLAIDEQALVENLFGNKGTLDSGEIYAVYTNEGVTYRDALHGSGKPEGGTIMSYWR